MKTRRRQAAGLLAAFLLVATGAGCGRGSNRNIRIDGIVGPNVNFIDNKMTFSLVLTGLAIDFGARLQIPQMPNSFVEVGPDFQTNGYLLFIGVDVGDVKALAGDGVNLLDPLTLPGGRPLPGIGDGMLPGVALELPKLNDVVIYVGDMLLGTFIPVPLPWKNYIGTFRFYDGTGAPIGNISVVGADSSNRNSGILLLISLRGRVGRLIAMN